MNMNELEENEKKILAVFINLMREIGRERSFTFLEKTEGGAGGFCIYKEDGKWITYTYEKGQKLGYREYDDLFSLCMDIFEALDKESTDYCIEVFPELVNKVMDNDSNKKTR